MTRHSIAILGRSGQVARALMREASERGIDAAAVGRPDVEITDYHSVAAYLYEAQPRVVINAAAYTAVDKAESEPDEAFRVNAEAPARLAVMCAAAGVPLLHISTDYVFDGRLERPYLEDDAMQPLSVYGASKAAGEQAVRAGCPRHMILRTSWVYGRDGHNFMRSMLRLGSERDNLSVVNDQHGAPTSADDLARAILAIATKIEASGPDAGWGTYHMTASGETTWHGFAAEIFRLAAAEGLRTPNLTAIPSSAFPTAALRPRNSRLDNTRLARTFGVTLPHWTHGLADTMRHLAPSRT